MRKALACRGSVADTHRGSGASNPADLRMKNLSREAALAEVRIAVKIFGSLHYTGRNTCPLQHHHDLIRRVVCRPFSDPVIELRAISHTSSRIGKSVVR